MCRPTIAHVAPTRGGPDAPEPSRCDCHKTTYPVPNRSTPRTSARHCLTGLTLFLLGAALAPRPAGAQASAATADERGPLVTEVELRGVKRLDPDELLTGIATRASECRTFLYTPICWVTKSGRVYERNYLDALELRRDVLRIRLFYWRRGYRDTRVVSRTDPDGDGVRVVFEVTEGAPTIVGRLNVRQDSAVLPRRVINRALQLRAGDPLDMIALDSSVVLLRDALWDRGYANAEIELDTARISEQANRGPVTIAVRPGPRTTVGGIEIEGNSRVEEETIRHLLTFERGDLFRRSELLESQRNLYLSGMFSEVDMEAPATSDTSKVVRLRVAEGDLRRLDLTTGFSTADFLQLEAVFTRYNFLGDGRRVTLRGTLANLLAPQLSGKGVFYDVTNGARGSSRNAFESPTWATSIDFTQPWFLSARNQLGASVFAHRRTVPGVVVDRGRGATLAFTRDHGPRVSTTLGYTYEASTIEASDVYFCVTFGVCLSGSINALARGNPLAPVTLTGLLDQSNDALNPTAGYRARFELEHASQATLSDFRYNRAVGTASRYFRVGRGSVLAGRVRLGWVHALSGTDRALGLPPDDEATVVHPRKRFYAGGSQSVRGFGENQLGPRVLTVAPEKLTRAPSDSQPAPCTTSQLADLSCDPNHAFVTNNDFNPQPLGGTSLVEGSVEFRFPLRFYEGLTGAVFIDGALIGTDRFSSILGATGAVTPGFGVRLATPIGPVRLDLGVRPILIERLPVITQLADSTGESTLVRLATARRYDPVDASGNILRQILGRLTLHLSVGPAF